MNKIKEVKSMEFYSLVSTAAIIGAVFIIVFVLFYPPMPGVADQGDFQRVMNVTGLGQIQSSANFKTHWFKYVTSEYNMNPLNLKNIARISGLIPTTSMLYPIMLARTVCRLSGMNFFSTRVLSVIYSIMYIIGLYICFRYIYIKSKAVYLLFVSLSILTLLDGNYLVWFNSLYGEPMMFIGLLLFISSILYVLSRIDNASFKDIVFIVLCSFLFLGAKMQCFSAMPIIVLLLIRIITIVNKHKNTFNSKRTLIISIFLLFYYVGGIYIQVNSSCSIDTEYNSVFYGILKNSDNPKLDLNFLGLSPDLAVDAGKHAYLPKYRYEKYIPGSDLTRREFNNKISNGKLLNFYILHPKRLIKGMEYTASKSLNTKSSLGKYQISDVSHYTSNFKRFTFWSDFRGSRFPKKLSFIILFYASVIIASVIEYRRHSNDITCKLRTELLWTIILIGLLQFPMPYIGNGEADTSKQLFLFNYTFDIVFIAACTWVFDKLYRSIKRLVLK